MVPKAVRRAESVKFASPKRTPSFTTRRRSFRTSKAATLEQDQLPPVECEGLLDRKQELQTGGKRATVRSWKTFYTVLCRQLLCFFKDKESFFGNLAAAPPLSVLGAKCPRAADYTKRKHVFTLQLNDGSEYLFTTNDESRMQEWLNKIAFHASLPPAMQLLSYDAHKDTSIYNQASNPSNTSNTSMSMQTTGSTQSSPYTNEVSRYDTSSQSSSSPDHSRKSSVSSNPLVHTKGDYDIVGHFFGALIAMQMLKKKAPVRKAVIIDMLSDVQTNEHMMSDDYILDIIITFIAKDLPTIVKDEIRRDTALKPDINSKLVKISDELKGFVGKSLVSRDLEEILINSLKRAKLFST